MCQKCVDAMRELFPEVGDEAMGDFLMSMTGFPFASAERVREQLERLKEIGREAYLLEMQNEMDAAVDAARSEDD